jgi:hypothetical protein
MKRGPAAERPGSNDGDVRFDFIEEWFLDRKVERS